ncbi:MAG TPA: hypothetical protein VLV81_08505 [Acidimicrobiia bacterium]|nr:hypothetical protein [Acidimicrobiia bacterium]
MRIRAVALLTALVTVGTFVIGVSGAEAKSAPKAAACAGSTKSQAVKQIKSAYDYFLNGTTKPPRTIDQREAYIAGMSDPALAALFNKGFGANAAAAATTNIKISAVTCTSKTAATVKADLVISGKVTPGIFPNPGGAVIENGVWKATKQTFCDLESLSDSTISQSGPCSVK